MTKTQQGAHPHGQLSAFARTHFGLRRTRIELRIRPLRGGLTADSVAHVTVRHCGDAGVRREVRFVVKRLRGVTAREAEIYRGLSAASAGALAPRLLGVERDRGDSVHLYLEAITRAAAWPWKDARFAGAVLERLSELHTAPQERTFMEGARSWDYEAELRHRARAALAQAEAFAADQRDCATRDSLPALRRVVMDLEAIRSDLMGLPLLRPTLLHGDVHTGNVLLRKRDGKLEPVLLDWGRARIGSPLEDVSSWLHSLGFWEPAVKRRHDTLLRVYLAARGIHGHPSRSVRDAYWLASMSNCLAGALGHHLESAAAPGNRSHARHAALAAAHHCLRIVRRADACWRSVK